MLSFCSNYARYNARMRFYNRFVNIISNTKADRPAYVTYMNALKRSYNELSCHYDSISISNNDTLDTIISKREIGEYNKLIGMFLNEMFNKSADILEELNRPTKATVCKKIEVLVNEAKDKLLNVSEE